MVYTQKIHSQIILPRLTCACVALANHCLTISTDPFTGKNVTTISYNNTPWITIFTSSEMASHRGKNLFDGNLNTMWLSNKTSGSSQIWYAMSDVANVNMV